jgi:hypothetical protein
MNSAHNQQLSHPMHGHHRQLLQSKEDYHQFHQNQYQYQYHQNWMLNDFWCKFPLGYGIGKGQFHPTMPDGWIEGSNAPILHYKAYKPSNSQGHAENQIKSEGGIPPELISS